MANDLRYTLSLKDLFSKNMDNALKKTEQMDGRMASLNSGFGRMGSLVAGAFSAAAVISFGRSVVDSLTKYEYFSASLRTLLHGDRNAANMLNEQLVQLAKTTPFSLEDVRSSSTKLLAYGFAAKEIVGQMKMLGDVSAATGNNIGDVAYLYGTLRTQGKAMTKDLYQFTNRGINVIPLLAKHFKVAESAVYDLASQGKIGFKDIENAFKTMTSEGGDFFNMMQEQSKTTGGRISNLGDAWDQLKISIGKSQTGILNSTVSWVTDMISALDRYMNSSDKMQESFKKYGGADYSFMQKTSAFLGAGLTGGGQKAKDAAYQSTISRQFVEPSSLSLKDAVRSGKVLQSLIKLKEKDAELAKDKDEQSRIISILKGSLSQVNKNIITLSKQSTGGIKSTGLDENGNPIKTDKTGIELKAARPQDLTINITKLVENLNIKAADLRDSAVQIKEAVAKALLEAVNDVNTVTR